MKLEIFPILPFFVDDRAVLDLSQRVACVEIDFSQRRGRFHFDDPQWEQPIRDIFDQDCLEFFGHGQGGDGVVTHPAWTQAALEVICRDRLTRLALGARPMLIPRGQDSQSPGPNGPRL